MPGQLANLILVMFFNRPNKIAKWRYLTRNLEGREADDEAMFEKRYEYVQEHEGIVREYREMGLLVEVDTGKGTEELWEKLLKRSLSMAG
jgi:adenylate kinase family enzyme